MAENFPELKFRANSRRLTTTRKLIRRFYFNAMQLFSALPEARRKSQVRALSLLFLSSHTPFTSRPSPARTFSSSSSRFVPKVLDLRRRSSRRNSLR